MASSSRCEKGRDADHVPDSGSDHVPVLLIDKFNLEAYRNLSPSLPSETDTMLGAFAVPHNRVFFPNDCFYIISNCRSHSVPHILTILCNNSSGSFNIWKGPRGRRRYGVSPFKASAIFAGDVIRSGKRARLTLFKHD